MSVIMADAITSLARWPSRPRTMPWSYEAKNILWQRLPGVPSFFTDYHRAVAFAEPISDRAVAIAVLRGLAEVDATCVWWAAAMATTAPATKEIPQ